MKKKMADEYLVALENEIATTINKPRQKNEDNICGWWHTYSIK